MPTPASDPPIRCHVAGCRADVAWQIVWRSAPAEFRLTCGAHLAEALTPGEINHALPYPFSTPSQEAMPCP